MLMIKIGEVAQERLLKQVNNPRKGMFRQIKFSTQTIIYWISNWHKLLVKGEILVCEFRAIRKDGNMKTQRRISLSLASRLRVEFQIQHNSTLLILIWCLSKPKAAKAFQLLAVKRAWKHCEWKIKIIVNATLTQMRVSFRTVRATVTMTQF